MITHAQRPGPASAPAPVRWFAALRRLLGRLGLLLTLFCLLFPIYWLVQSSLSTQLELFHTPAYFFPPHPTLAGLRGAWNVIGADLVAEAGGVVGDVVGVSGTGIAGLSLVSFARLLGAQTVVCVGRRKERLQRALDLGATHTVIAGPEADSLFRELGGAHAVFEASGKAPAVDTAYRWVRPGGRLIIYSAPDEPVPLDVMSAPREASPVVARPREGAVLRSVVNLVESGALPRLSRIHSSERTVILTGSCCHGPRDVAAALPSILTPRGPGPYPRQTFGHCPSVTEIDGGAGVISARCGS